MSRPGPTVSDVPLRAAQLVVGLCGALATALTHLVGAPAAGAAAVAMTGAALLARQQVARPVRAVLGFGALLVGTAAAALSGAAPLSVLTAAALTLLVTQQAVADTLRELAFAAALGMAVLLLAAGLAPAPALALPLLVGWSGAVVTLLLVQRERGRRGAGGVPAEVALPGLEAAAGHRGGGRSLAGDAAVAVGGSVLVALVVALLAPVPEGGAVRLAGLAGGGVGGAAGGERRSVAGYLGEALDMRTRGSLPPGPVADVPRDSPLHWRVAVLSDYDGVSWTPGPLRPTARAQVRDQAGADDVEVGAALADGDPTSTTTWPQREDDVRLLLAGNGVLLAPGHPRSLTLDGRAEVFSGSRVMLLADPGTAETAYRVTSTTVPDAADVAGPRVGAPTTPVPGGGRWSALPPSVTARTRALAARVTAGASTRGEQVAAVERYLRRTYAYQLDSPVPPNGQDAVDHFLFEARTGFCEQFAAAEIVLLRSVGVPARMATGYAGGEVRGDVRQLHGTDAHAWVEVWQPGVGWTTSDPTPAAAASAGVNPVVVLVRRVLQSRTARWAVAGGLVLVAALLALVVAWQRRRRLRRPVLPGKQRSTSSPQVWLVTDALLRLTAALHEAGRPSPPGETVAELAACVPELDPGAAQTVERTLYGRRPPAERQVDDAVRALDAAARQVREALEPAGAPPRSTP